MALAKQAEMRVGTALDRLARLQAYAGGALLVGMAFVTVASVIGRAGVPFGLSPIRGDFELMETGCALAIFAFLPWCQLRRGHVTVDVLANRLPSRFKAGLGLLGDATIALISGLILWRLYLGFGEKFPYFSDPMRAALGMGRKPFFPETTYELELPVWIPFGLATLAATLFFIVSLFTVWRALNAVLDGGEPT